MCHLPRIPGDARGASANSTGETQVNGRTAVWTDGFLVVDAPESGAGPEMNPTARWQTGHLSLGWAGDDKVSYRLRTDGLALMELFGSQNH